MGLNREQYRAAMHTDGPMLVLAGPGSGKTHLLVERIRMMIEDRGIDPGCISVITFSKKAALQMQARFEKQVGSYPVTFGTFHAVFYNILKDFDPDIGRLITEEEQKEFIRASLAPSAAREADDDEIIRLAGMVSAYRNSAGSYSDRAASSLQHDPEAGAKIAALSSRYESMCRKKGVIDFDDMILLCNRALYEHEMFLRRWQEKYRYILVDEFQDINEGQYDTLRLLAGDRMNVFAVGDDDQSIYAFRGARPELMKKFIRQYRGCAQVTLTMNYRCCRKVIGAADTLIRHNSDRLQRPMQENLPEKSGGYVEVICAESAPVQAMYVCDRIEELIEEKGYSLRDFAVLYRSDHCAKIFGRTAKERGLYSEKDESGSIRMMTAHASKGLEFSCVFIIGLQEGLFPHYLDMEGDCEEERRLMYVAMTRARERLFLCALGTEHGKRISRFVTETIERKKYISDYLILTRV